MGVSLEPLYQLSLITAEVGTILRMRIFHG